MKTMLKYTVATCVAALLVACGGGGGGGDNSSSVDNTITPPPPIIPGKNAWQNFLTSNKTYNLSGQDSQKNSYQMTLTLAYLGDVNDSNGSYYVTEITGAARLGNSANSYEKIRFFTSKNDLKMKFFLIWPLESECGSIENAETVPMNISLYNTGNLVNGRVYSYSNNVCYTNSYSFSKYSISWSYEADGIVPLMCFNVKTDPFPGDPTNSSLCFEVNKDGVIGARAKYREDDIVLRNY